MQTIFVAFFRTDIWLCRQTLWQFFLSSQWPLCHKTACLLICWLNNRVTFNKIRIWCKFTSIKYQISSEVFNIFLYLQKNAAHFLSCWICNSRIRKNKNTEYLENRKAALSIYCVILFCRWFDLAVEQKMFLYLVLQDQGGVCFAQPDRITPPSPV